MTFRGYTTRLKARLGLGLLLPLVLALGTGPANASERARFEGKVVGIADGDTLTVQTQQGRRVRVRLAGIDAPEGRQPWGSRSTDLLGHLAYGKQAEVSVINLDRYGRSVARVQIGTTYVNREMVRQGGAWAYRKYLTEPTFLSLEAEARSARAGLWALPPDQTMAPWAWRSKRREAGAEPSDGRRTAGDRADGPGAGSSSYDVRKRPIHARPSPDLRRLPPQPDHRLRVPAPDTRPNSRGLEPQRGG